MPWTIQVVTLDLANPHAGWWCPGVDDIFTFCNEAHSRANGLVSTPSAVLVSRFPIGMPPDLAKTCTDPEDKLLVLYSGIASHYRFLRLLKLASDQSRVLGLRLCVVTSGSRAQAWMARRLGDRVRVAGVLEHSQFINLLRHAEKVLAKAGPSLIAEAAQWAIRVDFVYEAGNQEEGNILVYHSGQLGVSPGDPGLVSRLLSVTSPRAKVSEEETGCSAKVLGR